jgi:hypothetical protein
MNITFIFTYLLLYPYKSLQRIYPVEHAMGHIAQELGQCPHHHPLLGKSGPKFNSRVE